MILKNQTGLSLNGKWKFKWVKSPKNSLKQFYKYDIDDNNWDLINVPGNWEVEGDTSWGRPVYEEYTIPPNEYSYSFILIPSNKE